MAEKFEIDIVAETRKIQKDLTVLNKQVNGLAKQGEKTNKSFKRLFETGNALKMAGAVATVGFGIGKLVGEAAKIETISTQFEVLTGSAEEAAKAVEELQQFSANTPFQFQDIARAGKQLLGFGFQADELQDKLRSIGDVASAIGQPIGEIGLIFGQVSAAGKLTGERLLQFQERAVPIAAALAETMKVPETAIKDLVSAGKVDFATFEKAFQSLSQEGGLAFEGMAKQSQTLEGQISTLKDNLSLLGAELGVTLLPVIKDTVQFITRLAKGAKSMTEEFKDSKKSTEELKKEQAELNESLKRVEETALRLKKNTEGGIIGRFFSKSQADEQTEIFSNLAVRKGEIEAELAKREIDIQKEKDARIKEAALAKAEAEEAEYQRINAVKIARDKEDVEREKKISKIIEEQKKASLDKQLKAEVKYREDVKNSNKQIADAKKYLQSEDVKNTQTVLGNLSTLTKANSKELFAIGKAASIAQAVINTAQGVTKALAQGGIFGPILAASVAAAGAVQISTITAQKFATGGVVTGGQKGVDSVPALLQQGEIVAPRQNFNEVVESVARSRGFSQDGEASSSNEMQLTIGFAENAFEVIETKLNERVSLGFA